MLGGSFDPVHNAHLILARLALEQLALDRIHFVVAASQPFKRGQHGAPAADRLHMVELAVTGLGGFVADGRELRRPAPSYTIDSLRELTAENPSAELMLIMGADVFARLREWREPDAIRSLARVAVCHRPGADVSGESPDFTVEVPALDLSSSLVRRRAAAEKSIAGWVPGAVADYIVASRIYRSHAG